MLKSEVEDLRIVSTSLEKHNKELQGREKQLSEAHEKLNSQLEIQVLKLESEVEKKSRELSSAFEEQERLRDLEENAQATTAFFQHKTTELEERLATVQQDYRELDAEHKVGHKPRPQAKKSGE